MPTEKIEKQLVKKPKIPTVKKKIIEPPIERQCGGECGKLKKIEEFPKAKNNSGYSYWCKECSVKKSYFDPNIDPNTTKKKCKGPCQKDKYLIEYTKQKQGIYGYANLCIECRKIKRRENLNIEANYKGTKICNGMLCNGKILQKSQFNKDKYSGDGLQTVCKKCQIYKTNVTYSNFYSFIVKLLNDCRSRVKKKATKGRTLEYNIDKDYIIELYNKQKGKCAITEIEMTYNAINEKNPKDSCHIINKHNISIDRIDSSKGYTKDNVRLICAVINSIRFDSNDKDFYEICRKIASPKKEKVKNIDEIIESKEFLKYVNYKLTNAKFNAKNKKRVININENDIIEQHKKQKGRCNLTKEKLSFIRNNKTAMAIDRIDSTKSYTKDNIHLVTENVNQLKSDLDLEEFREICRLIVEKT